LFPAGQENQIKNRLKEAGMKKMLIAGVLVLGLAVSGVVYASGYGMMSGGGMGGWMMGGNGSSGINCPYGPGFRSGDQTTGTQEKSLKDAAAPHVQPNDKLSR
jgi:hypothetical protein